MHAGSRPRQHTPSKGSHFSVRRALPTFLPVVVAVVLLPLIAFASPPDPSWVAGIYDGADGDDIVTLVDDIASIEAGSPPTVPRHHRSFQQLLVSRSDISSGFSSRPFSRGPPPPSALLSARCAYVSSRLLDPVAAALLREAFLALTGTRAD